MNIESAVDPVIASSNDLNTAGSEPSRRRWRESVKALSPRQNVVLSAPSASRTGLDVRIENMAPESWQPQNIATRHLSDRAPFAYALSGYDPDRVALEGYACWTVP